MDSLSTLDIIVNSIGFVLITAGVCAFIYTFWKFSDPVFDRTTLKRRRQYKKVFKGLYEGVRAGAVNNNTDFISTYETSFNKNIIPYTEFLKRFNAWITANTKELERIEKVKEVITPILEAELEREPFEGLSDEDKNAFTSIEAMASKSEFSDAIKAHLISISNSLRNSNESVKSNGVLNKFALGVSIASILVTIGLQFFAKPSISKESIESINNNTKQQIELAVDSIKTSLVPSVQDNNDKD